MNDFILTDRRPRRRRRRHDVDQNYKHLPRDPRPAFLLAILMNIYERG